jgi:ABC-type transport system involved in cytochrome c biogenesis ATPase subunit
MAMVQRLLFRVLADAITNLEGPEGNNKSTMIRTLAGENTSATHRLSGQ